MNFPKLMVNIYFQYILLCIGNILIILISTVNVYIKFGNFSQKKNDKQVNKPTTSKLRRIE